MRVHIWPSEHRIDDDAWRTIVDLATRNSGRRAADLVWEAPRQVISLAGI